MHMVLGTHAYINTNKVIILKIVSPLVSSLSISGGVQQQPQTPGKMSHCSSKSPDKGVRDMTEISNIDELGINRNLKVRYDRDEIYVSFFKHEKPR